MNNKIILWNILHDIVKAYPATVVDEIEQKHLRINTFAVVHSQAQLEAANLNKDARYLNKNLFYSREWEQSNFDREITWNYPLLAAWSSDNSRRTEFLDNHGKKTEEIVFAIIDRNLIKDPGEAYITGTNRTFEEVETNLEEMMDYILKELRSYVLATVSTGTLFPQTNQAWYPKYFLQAKLANGDINSFEINDLLTNHIVNSSSDFTNLHEGFLSDDVSTHFIKLTIFSDICLSSSSFNYDFLSLTPPFTGQEHLYRLNCALNEDYVDTDGNTWIGDDEETYFVGEGWGNGDYWWLDVEGTDNDRLYETFRYEFGFEYRFPVPAGLYKVVLHWSESVQDEIGDRVMDIEINGVAVMSGVDIVALAGGKNIAHQITFEGIVDDNEIINIEIIDDVDYAILCAIEIIRVG